MRAPTRIPVSPSRRDQYIAMLAKNQQTMGPGQSAGVRVHHTTKGVLFDAPSPLSPGGEATLSLYSLLAVRANYLVCYEYNASENTHGTTEVLIAKPHELQKNYWSGKTINGFRYTATDATPSPLAALNKHVNRLKTAVTEPTTGTESSPWLEDVNWTEMVWPPYIWQNNGPTDEATPTNDVGGIIVAFDLEHAITFPSESVEVDGVTYTEPERTITKMELPWRHWVPIERPIVICEESGGVVRQRRAYIRASQSLPMPNA